MLMCIQVSLLLNLIFLHLILHSMSLSYSSLKPKLSPSIHMNKTRIIMDFKTFLKQHLKTILLALFLVAIVLFVISGVRKLSNHTLVVGHPDNIVVITPNESQDIIVIGDPQQVKVKPKNKNIR